MSSRLLIVTLLCALCASPAQARIHDLTEELPEPLRDRTEFGFVPIVGGDSDIGIAVGLVGSVAHFDETGRPYAWRLEVNGIISFLRPNNQWVNPFQDYYIKLTVPSLAHNKLRLTARAAYTRYGTLRYFGLGNASERLDIYSKFAQYQLSYPHGTLELRYTFAKALSLSIAGDYYYEHAIIYTDSKLANDLRQDPGEVKGAGAYSMALATAALVWDTRDDETAPQQGQYHSLSVRASPGDLIHTPYQFVGVNASLRGYVPLWRPYLMLAARIVGDALAGDVPFFQLAESADGYAVGGINGVRGVPAQRYYGKIKTYGSLEARVTFPAFKAFDQDLVLGFVAFYDAGRVWAGYRVNPSLDGTGVGVKYGVGGGIRVRLGETFLLRGDGAWSPDAQPAAFYFNVGQAF